MGIMDSIKNLAGSNPQIHGIVSGLQNFVSENGGVEGLKAKFEKEGAGPILQSWIGKGQNLPIGKEQIEKVMGSQFVQDVAKKMGVDPAVASEKLTQVLPTIIDKLSPNGKLPDKLDSQSLASAAADVVKKEH